MSTNMNYFLQHGDCTEWDAGSRDELQSDHKAIVR
jgi:hypothetical protein